MDQSTYENLVREVFELQTTAARLRNTGVPIDWIEDEIAEREEACINYLMRDPLNSVTLELDALEISPIDQVVIE